MSKHTPGPWPIEHGSSGRFIKAIGPCSAEEYAGSAWLEVSEEDACLIAAAPELLEALETCLLIVEHLASDSAPSTIKEARAAIKKATGE